MGVTFNVKVSVYDNKGDLFTDVVVPTYLRAGTKEEFIKAIPDISSKALQMVVVEACKAEGNHIKSTAFQHYVERNMQVAYICKAGDTQAFVVDGQYANDTRCFGDTIHAVDELDAEFKALWMMAEKVATRLDVRDMVSSDFPRFQSIMAEQNISSIIPEASIAPVM